MSNRFHIRDFSWTLLPAALVLAVPTISWAHTGVGAAAGLLQGVGHPLSGYDHLCAMLAVGLWAAQRGGRAVWLIPLAFVSVMAVGGALGMAAVSLPMVERGIAASVLVLGLLVAASVRMPLAASAILVGIFALFHGHAHGTEMAANVSGALYATGFLLSTLALHAAGVGAGLLATKMPRLPVMRIAGASMALFGLLLCLN